MSHLGNIRLRSDPRYDSKWFHTDIGIMFSNDGLSKLWNEMALDGELTGNDLT